MRALDSLILRCAEAHRVPAGSALAVNREGFAAAVTQAIAGHSKIQVIREEVPDLPAARPAIVASGPLTSDRLAASLAGRFAAFLGPEAATSRAAQWLYFYDAISPIVARIDQLGRPARPRCGVGAIT
jgi:methylenetetrahydrofolate--tRNA-(uracil-5-)-methyltransferase